MKHTILFAVALFVLISFSPVYAESNWVTKKGYVGCLSKELLKNYMSYKSRGDKFKD